MTLQEEFPAGMYLHANGWTMQIVGYEGFNLCLQAFDGRRFRHDVDELRSWGYRLGRADGTIVRTHGVLGGSIPAAQWPADVLTREQLELDSPPEVDASPTDDMQQLVQQLLTAGITPEALQQAVMQVSAGNNADASPRRRVLRINEQARNPE